MSQSNKPKMPGPGHGPGMRPGEKAKNFSGTMKKLVSYMKPYYFQIILILIFAACSTICTIVAPKILGNATTKLAEGIISKYSHTGGIDFDAIGTILLTLLGIYDRCHTEDHLPPA